MTGARVFLLPAAADLPDWAARRIVERHRAALPDLSRVAVLLPSWPAAAALRRSLARHAGRGLLGPQVQLAATFAASRAGDGPALSALDCRLLLAEALGRHRDLFPGQDRSQAADALFALFEELAANDADLPDDESRFAERLRAAYGARPLDQLSCEAQIVHRLWRAFQADSEGRSPAMAYRRRLAAAFASLGDDERVYLVGFDRFTRAEAKAVGDALRAGRAELILQGRMEGHDGAALRELCRQLEVTPEMLADHPSPYPLPQAEGERNFDARGGLLDAAFSENPSPHPLPQGEGVKKIRIVEADGAEHEARCVDLAVRQALLSGARDVAVLAPDRALARRLRALLERAGVPLEDHVGWALSTSQAAAALKAWLDCQDSGFHFRPLLALLKSGFVNADAAALRALEMELVYRRRVERGLRNFIDAARDRPALHAVLERVRAAAQPGLPGDAALSAARRADSLLHSLAALGVEPALRADEAGRRLLELFEQMLPALRRTDLRLTGAEFRLLLERALDGETFVPSARTSPVRLLTLEQSHNLRCDVLILANATRAHLPGAGAEPFFNQSVRLELGLPGWPQRQAAALARLRCALEAAPQVLVTYSAEHVQDVAQLSPWLEAVEAQAQLAGLDLRDRELPRLAGSAAVEICAPSERPPATARPAPAAAADLLPAELSATAHQKLVDCPYAFHAHALLNLRLPEPPDEDRDRSHYGRHVHLILQAFTEQVPGLPAPFGDAVRPANRAQAQARLEELAQAVLAPELEAHALARTWLSEFRAAIPAFLDWLEERPQVREVRAEVRLAAQVGAHRIYGKADRLELRADGSRAIVDYKTGGVPHEDEVTALESVQLLHYAALDAGVTAAEYLPLKSGIKPLALDHDLARLRDQSLARLRELLDRVQAQTPLPAHGDDATCRFCDYLGLCRKGDWADG